MPDAIRTRCKFRVVAVEDTEHIVTENVYAATDPNGFDSLVNAQEWPDSQRGRYKVKQCGLAQNVRLAASYDTSNPEDVSFAQATPSGEVRIYVSNPAVIGTFKPGKNYYLDLIPCA